MERMFAVAVRDRDDLFLWLRLRRAAGTDIYYVVPTGREQDPKWEKWSRGSLAAVGLNYRFGYGGPAYGGPAYGGPGYGGPGYRAY